MPIIFNGKTVAGIYHAGHRTLDPTGAVPTGKEKPAPAHRADFSPEKLACHPFTAWQSSDTGESLE